MDGYHISYRVVQPIRNGGGYEEKGRKKSETRLVASVSNVFHRLTVVLVF